MLRAHLECEIRYAAQVLAPLMPTARQLQRQMAGKAMEGESPFLTARSGWSYQVQRPAGRAHRIVTRRHANGSVQVLLDEGERARPHRYYRATDYQISVDERFLAWAEDVRGDDRFRICVLDIEQGTVRTLVDSDAFGYGALVFSPSSRYLFWIWRDAHSRPTRLYRSPLDGAAAALVLEERDPALFMQVKRTADDRYVVLTLAGPDTSEVHLIGADAETAPPRVVRSRRLGIRYEVESWHDALVMRTNADGAFDGKLVSLDPASLQCTGELVAHTPGNPILHVQPFARALVRLERVSGLPRLVLMQRNGQEVPVVFDEAAYALTLVPGQSYDASAVQVVHQTPARPPVVLDIDLTSGRMRTTSAAHNSGLARGDYRVERLHARAADGQTVPITVLSRRDASGPGPLLLTGYGAYGIAYDTVFSLPALTLVDAGFRYAIAHVRGGSEKGWLWYQQGCRENKRRSMEDFIACAQHLQATGVAAPGKIVAHGVSAGGLLVCGAMNMAPSLWAGVLAEVPFVDMLNTMSDADHPLVPLLRPDWGDPLASVSDLEHIAAISPCENVRPAAYPPVLCTAGLQDDRVPFWEPAKLVAHLRAHSTSGNPAVLLLDPDSGHQQSDNLAQACAQASILWAFALHCVGARPEPTPARTKDAGYAA